MSPIISIYRMAKIKRFPHIAIKEDFIIITKDVTYKVCTALLETPSYIIIASFEYYDFVRNS